MDRINSTGTTTLSTGVRGFQDKNLTAGIQGTQVNALFMNPLQEELMLIIETIFGAGSGSATNMGQIMAALRIIREGSAVICAASQTVTAPSWATKVKVRAVGGGGGAGGCVTNAGGGGGGAGGYVEGTFTVAGSASIVVTIGAGGAGGASGANGSSGGTTSVGSLCSATGGAGGGAAGNGGAGGLGVGGSINDYGGFGSDGSAGGVVYPGNGGVSAFGGGGRAAASPNSAIQNGAAPGSGGGACYYNAGSGGTGAYGLAILEFIA